MNIGTSRQEARTNPKFRAGQSRILPYKSAKSAGRSSSGLSMALLSLREIHQRYVTERRPLETSLGELLRADGRPGARAILATIEKRRFKNRSEGQRLRKMLRFENDLWKNGYHAVAGVD